ncbi:MAG: Imidazolonepropionase, partial [uncultured Arthrobacter sp.]
GVLRHHSRAADGPERPGGGPGRHLRGCPVARARGRGRRRRPARRGLPRRRAPGRPAAAQRPLGHPPRLPARHPADRGRLACRGEARL